MDVSAYLSPFLISFFIAIVCVSLMRGFFRAQSSLADTRRGDRHIHKAGTLRFGGVALITSFLLTVFLDDRIVLTTAWWGVILVSLFILSIGLLDDIREVSWKIQLLAQLTIGSIAFAFGIRLLSITTPFGAFFFDSGWLPAASFVVTVVWIVAVMNAVNWADGVDGLSGGISFIAFMTIFFLSLRPEVNQPPVAIFSLILAGSSLGFLVFNFHPARIFAGTSGSWFLGFMLAALALFSGTKIATSVSVLALPILDALWVIYDRFHSGVSIFTPDTRHLHYRLARLGWSPYAIAFFFYAITITTATVALHTDALGKTFALCFFSLSALLLFISLRKKALS